MTWHSTAQRMRGSRNQLLKKAASEQQAGDSGAVRSARTISEGDILDTLQRGVQWIGGAVDWGSIV